MALRVSSLLLTEERKLPFRDVWVDWGIFFLHDSGEKTRVFCIFESGGDFGDFGEGTGPKKKVVVIQDTVDDSGAPSHSWKGNTYEELLDRVFNILRDRESNLELARDRRRIVLRPPQVLREGTDRTVFVNFIDECKMMYREPNHVMTFLLTELGRSGSLDGQQRRWQAMAANGGGGRWPAAVAGGGSLAARYDWLDMDMWHKCLFSLKCEKCGSKRSVAQIKADFLTRVGSRNART
ncbi:hypothetical protein PRUPE_1G279600 [Prunus persica]|uniref:Translation initiation factor IF2/IF5 domain-containing protein n=1 Tax=Prunus persica TaxID=3760 RepID=A0A251R4G7_PRUPE|nr:hypothetical protein PRUPE_1G279600 [Prunus persica]